MSSRKPAAAFKQRSHHSPLNKQTAPLARSKAFALYAQGNVTEALVAAKQAMTNAPPDASLLNLAAVCHLRFGHLEQAESCWRQALRIKPDHVETCCNLGYLLKKQKRYNEAEAAYRQALQIKPDNAEVCNAIGLLLFEQKRYDEAQAAYRQALHIKPSYAEACNNVGILYFEQKRYNEAETAYRQTLQIKPDYADAFFNLGILFKEQRRYQEAEAAYQQVLHLKPDSADACYNLGILLKEQKRYDEAEAAYRQTLRLKPDCAEAYNNIGVLLKERKRYPAAEEAYQQALHIKPDYAEAYNNCGILYHEQNRFQEAEEAYQQALRIKPDSIETCCNMGSFLASQSRISDAEAILGRVLELDPNSCRAAIQANLLLPIIPVSLEEIEHSRLRYQEGITRIEKLPCQLDDPGAINLLSYYLAYHNRCNRPLLESQHRLFRHKSTTLTCVASWQPASSNQERIRVGFLSQLFTTHTIGNLYQGLLSHLDRTRFELVLIHTHKTVLDAFSTRLATMVDKVIILPSDLATQQQIVAAEQLDLLFYPDIGMSPITYFLAYARLAPVQVVSWGHPDTTGLDTVDYFLSSTMIEPDDADEYYSERLIRFHRLPCYYPLPVLPESVCKRSELGLPETGRLYGCPQSLFKFHPDFDAILAAIAEGDPDGRIVLIESPVPRWSEILKQRWATTFPILLDRVLFSPRLTAHRFMALLANMDLLLDPIHFGSGNTLYEAMAVGVPIVTWPGRFMRGRIVAGAYRQMELTDPPVAARMDQYAPLALALGQDAQRRALLKQAILDNAHRLYSDAQAIHEFEVFVTAAVASAVRGEKLPKGWTPKIWVEAKTAPLQS